MVPQNRMLRVAAWVAAVVGAMLLVLTFVLREYSYRVHPDLIHALMYPVPAVVVVALLAGVLVAAACRMPSSTGRADRAASWPASRWHCCRWRCWSRRGCGGGIERLTALKNTRGP